MNELKEIPVYLWIIIGIILSIQSTWIYFDASKRNENKWIWALFGLLSAPSSLIIYLIVTRVVLKKPINCNKCEKRVSEKYNYCPYCGEKI